jgi:outer membrane protein assembly factor BamE
MRLIAILAAALLAGACSLVYTIDVQQGNHVTKDVVDKVTVGMTRAQVRQILGTPLLVDPFHSNQWDYYFSNVKGGKPENRTRLTIYFKDDKVERIAGEGRPTPPPQTAPSAVSPAQAPAPAAGSAAAPKK